MIIRISQPEIVQINGTMTLKPKDKLLTPLIEDDGGPTLAIGYLLYNKKILYVIDPRQQSRNN